jgi:hypothetical protein
VRRLAAALVLLCAACTTSPSAPPPSPSAAPTTPTTTPTPTATPKVSELFRIRDPRIDEASGIAAGRRSPGVVYVHNDSGDSARFFALDERTGATAATIIVPGATSHDWEDIAVAPDATGHSSVWLADIGDNTSERSRIEVYRVDEPVVRPGDRGRRMRAPAPDTWLLRYPDGPHNAESFAVTPQGVGYIVTKSEDGRSRVYRIPPRPDPGHLRPVTFVAAVTFDPGLLGGAATGADFSRDGSLFVVRTYTDAYLWRVRRGDLAAALHTAPVRFALPLEQQGEGIAFDGDRLLVDSEGLASAVYAVPLPKRAG